MQLLPGFDGAAPTPEAPPPPPTRQDPAIGIARKKQKLELSRRKGRRSTILTSGRGVEDQLGVTRPQARGALLLGG